MDHYQLANVIEVLLLHKFLDILSQDVHIRIRLHQESPSNLAFITLFQIYSSEIVLCHPVVSESFSLYVGKIV